ncbi:MAG: hypothetical protein PHS44_02450 [Candidatus Dojkabacteria bacterium]|nr:hypothetical protein [Candidatus Dojkabacteria bacterium]
MKKTFKNFKTENKLTANEEKMLDNIILCKWDEIHTNKDESSHKKNLFSIFNLKFVLALTFILIAIFVLTIIAIPSLFQSPDSEKQKAVTPDTDSNIAVPQTTTSPIFVPELEPREILETTITKMEDLKSDNNIVHVRFIELYADDPSFNSLYDKVETEKWLDIASNRFKEVTRGYKDNTLESEVTTIYDGIYLHTIMKTGGDPFVSSHKVGRDYHNLPFDPIEFNKTFYSKLLESGRFEKVAITSLDGKDCYLLTVTFQTSLYGSASKEPETTQKIYIDKETNLPLKEEFTNSWIPTKIYEIQEYLLLTDTEVNELFSL